MPEESDSSRYKSGQPESKGKHSERMLRWLAEVEGIEYQFLYCPGRQAAFHQAESKERPKKASVPPDADKEKTKEKKKEGSGD